MTAPRPSPLAPLLLVPLLVLLPAVAWAHGGNFRAPGAPPTGPGLGPAPLPAVITPGETWQTYWDLNRMGLIPGRDDILKRQSITPRGESAETIQEGWSRRRLVAARDQVIPYLLSLVDPKRKVRDEVRGAALIALGKITDDDVAYRHLLYWLGDRATKPLVGESAALAIGLLCRSHPKLQRSGAELDRMRDALIAAIDHTGSHIRVRSFAALALGLLGDQPYGTPVTQDGKMVVRAIWKRFGPRPRNADLPACMLVAIGMQPRDGVSKEVMEGLKQIVAGKRVCGRKWVALERSHALMALAHLDAHGVDHLMIRILQRPQEPVELRRAAYISFGRRATALTSEERADAAEAVVKSMERRRDPMTVGLGHMATGRLLAADIAAGEVTVLERTNIPKLLLDAAENATSVERGYATLALAFAAQGARASGHALPFLMRAKKVMLDGYLKGRGDDSIRASYAVGIGLLGIEEGIEPLLDAVRDRGAMPVLRGHAAVALGQIGRRVEEVRPSLLQLLKEKRGVLLRVRAAMGLALIGGSIVRTQLLKELESADSEYHKAHVVIALGRLGDLRAVPALMAYAKDESNSELSRALGVVALGLITDPEPRPSILKLTRDANFPAATQILYSAYSIF